MQPITKLRVSHQANMRQSIEVIEQGGLQIALVVDDNGKLVGTVTDGDVRRALLRGADMHGPVTEIMNKSPHAVFASAGRGVATQVMASFRLRHVPVLGDNGELLGVEYLDELLRQERRDSWVVLMAGGLGTRLRPITETTPKPLIPIGGRPLLEGIIASFAEQGFQRFFLSLNYKSELFRAHFGNGSALGVSIEYLQESEPLGTAGSLSLMPERPDNPFIVMNGDLLTSMKFDRLVDFHTEHNSAATMCVREYKTQVPYGVVETDEHRFLGVVEKPTQTFFVNAGIYAVSPEALDLIPRNTIYNMTDLFADLNNLNKEVSVFPMREYWLDVGRFEDLERAQLEYDQVFSR